MTREETVKYLYDLLKKHSVKVNEVDVIPVSSCIALVDEVINHEQDTLKEFVEWAINCVSVGNDISECKTLATSLTTDADTREFCTKRYAAFSQYSSGLRFGLEQFLKMKGIEEDKNEGI